MKNVIVLLGACLLLAISCKKKKTDDTPIQPPPGAVNMPPPPSLIINVPSDASGILIASLIPYSFGNGYTTALGNASAFFYTSPGNYNYVDAGTVMCNDSSLTKLSGGSYMFSGHQVMQPQSGISFSSGSQWSVSGSTAPAFTFTASQFPTAPAVTSSGQLYKNSTYNLNFGNISNADSISIYLGCDSNVVRKVVAGNVNSVMYTAIEISSVKKAVSAVHGYFNITPYKLQSTTAGGKKYYIANANTTTFTVNIQ